MKERNMYLQFLFSSAVVPGFDNLLVYQLACLFESKMPIYSVRYCMQKSRNHCINNLCTLSTGAEQASCCLHVVTEQTESCQNGVWHNGHVDL